MSQERKIEHSRAASTPLLQVPQAKARNSALKADGANQSGRPKVARFKAKLNESSSDEHLPKFS